MHVRQLLLQATCHDNNYDINILRAVRIAQQHVPVRDGHIGRRRVLLSA